MRPPHDRQPASAAQASKVMERDSISAESPTLLRETIRKADAVLADFPFPIAVLVTILVVILVQVFFTPRYETNDDSAMNLIAAGLVFVDHPDEHLVFTNVLIGLPLRWLYEASPRVPWYGLYQLISLSLSCVSVIYVLLRIRPSIRQTLVIALFLAAIMMPCLAKIQFTKTAFLASSAGLLLFLAPLLGVASRARLTDGAGIMLIVFGSLIRLESLQMACVMALPAAGMAARGKLRVAAGRILLLAIALILVAGGRAFNASYYACDPRWRDFFAYNALRAEFTDYDRYYASTGGPAFEEVGWQPIDLRMIKNWAFADPERYSLAKLRQIVTQAPADPPALLVKVAGSVLGQVSVNSELLRLCLAAVGVTLLAVDRRGPFLAAALFAQAFVIAVLLAGWYWITPRVAFSLLMGVFIGIVACTSGDVKRSGMGQRRILDKLLMGLVACLTVTLLVWMCIGLATTSSTWRDQHKEGESALLQLKPRSDQLFVVWADQLPYELLVTPYSDPDGLRDFRCVALSWLTPTPFTTERLQAFHISDIYRAIWERSDVFLVAVRDLVTIYEDYVLQHYDQKVDCQVVFDSSHFEVFQIKALASSSERKRE
jgi:hypothetical protein